MSQALLSLLLISAGLPSISAVGYDPIGVLTPANEFGVLNSISNLNEVADYTFSFIPTTTIPAGGLLNVGFPQQFSTGLGITGTPVCTGGTCTITGWTVTITLTTQALAGLQTIVVVTGVKNPSFAGGTGPFSLVSYSGISVLDMNLEFGVIGISDAVKTMASASVALSPGFSPQVGDASSYDFFFRTERGISVGNWMSFTFPTAFVLTSTPTCSAVPIQGYSLPGALTCKTTGSQVTLRGIVNDVPAGTNACVRVSVTNPLWAGTTGSFTLQTGRGTTNAIFERISGVSGVVIAPGKVTGVTLTPADPQMMMAAGKVMPYILRFTLTNPVPAGGSIKILFNSAFNMGILTGTYIISGLNDLSSSSSATIVYTGATFTLVLANFAAYTKQEIALFLPLTNSGTPGNTPPLVIYSLLPDGVTLIDQDAVSAYVLIASTTAPTMTPSFPSYQAGIGLSLQINITPNVQIPALGYVAVRFPSGFQVTTPAPTCLAKPYTIGATNTACVYVNGIINIQLFASTVVPTAGPGDFVVGFLSNVQITAGVFAANSAGVYYLDVNTYDTTYNLLESGTCVITLTATVLTTYAFSSVHSGTDRPTILIWSLTPLQNIPQSQSSQGPQGFIEIQLPTKAGVNLQFRLDLGLGLNQGNSVPCLSITNISGLSCVLTTKPAVAAVGNNLFITISGFSALPANTNIVFHLAGIKHSQTVAAVAVTLTIYQVFNRIRTDINTVAAAVLTNPPSVAGTAQTDNINFTSISTVVSSITNISGTIKFVTAIAAAPTLVLFQISTTHDNGYCSGTTTSFSCALAGVTYPCTCYPVVDMVLITLGTFTVAANISKSIVLSNFRNPNSVAAANDKVTVYTIATSAVKDVITYTNSLPAQTPGTFSLANVTPSATGAGYVNVLYTINLVGSHSVPLGGNVLITFPALYAMTTSVPLPVCSVTGLTQASGTGVACAVGATSVTVSNFLQTSSAQPVSITLSGVKNPAGTGSSGTFWFTTRNSSGLTIDTNSNVAGFTFSSSFVTSVLTPSITAYPSNAGATAEYVFKFTPSNPIGVGGTISVVFPTQFGTMPTTYTCRLSTPVTTIKSCAKTGNTFTITLDKSYTSSAISFSIFSIQNFATAGTSSAFSISTMYDGVVLDQTATTSLSTAVVITATAPALTVNSVSFSPMNEGESAVYAFNFFPTFSFSALQHPVVTFPAVYDKRVGKNLKCWASGLLGTLTCNASSAYQVTVTGNQAFAPCGACNIILYISGVLNPPATSATGYLSLGILSGTAYLGYQSSAANLLVTPAPTLLYLNSYSASNFYSRYNNEYTFNVTTTQSIPSTSSQGALWIMFPDQYLLANSALTSNTSVYWASGAPNTTMSSNTVQLNGQTAAYTGSLLIQLMNVPNPMQAVTTDSIVLKTVDAFNGLVLDRTYPNLNPTEMTFAFSGPLISVNNDQPIVIQSGMYSGPISIAVVYPCTRNLTFTPQLDGFVISPTSISLSIGQLSAYFIIGAPVTVSTLENVMLWTVSGEANPVYYSPLSKTIVLVQNSSLATVGIDAIPPVPIGGHSLPFRVYLTLGPVNDVTVDLQVSPTLTGVTLSPASLTFTAGQTQQYTEILTSAGLAEATGSLSLALSGSDAALYTLPTAQFSLSIFNNTDNLPVISTVSAIEYKKTTATIAVGTNVQGILYYMYAYAGTAVPDFTEVKSAGPAPYDATRSRYGNLTITAAHYGSVVITDLQAGRDYVFFAYLQDLLDRVAVTYSSTTFSTMPLAQMASTSLRFLQAYMNDYEVSLVKEAITLILSLADWQIATTSIQYTSNSGRRLIGTGQTYTVLTFAIVDNPFNDNYPTPIDLVTRLSASVNELSGRVSNLDINYAVVGTVVSYGDCQFARAPILYSGGRADQTLSFSAVLKSNGIIYTMCVLESRDTGSPYMWQVQAGLSASNVPMNSLSKSVSGLEVWNTTYNNLLPDSRYTIYFVCGNAQPVFPALLAKNFLIGVVANTTATPNPKMLVITGSPWRLVGVVVSLLVLL